MIRERNFSRAKASHVVQTIASDHYRLRNATTPADDNQYVIRGETSMVGARELVLTNTKDSRSKASEEL